MFTFEGEFGGTNTNSGLKLLNDTSTCCNINDFVVTSVELSNIFSKLSTTEIIFRLL